MNAPLDLLRDSFAGRSLIEASAGTGKTWTLTALYARMLLQEQLSVGQILVVTYTTAATAELRERIRKRLAELLAVYEQGHGSDALLNALHDQYPGDANRRRLLLAVHGFDEAAIFTIHGFCQRALQDAAFEAGGDFDNELSSDDREILDALIADLWRHELASAEPEWAAFLAQKKVTPQQLRGQLRSHLGKPFLRIEPALGSQADMAPLRAAWQHARDFWQRDGAAWIEQLKAFDGLNKRSYDARKIGHWQAELDGYFSDAAALFSKTEAPQRLSREALLKATLKGREVPLGAVADALQGLVEALAASQPEAEQRLVDLKVRLIAQLNEQLPARKAAQRILAFDDLLNRLNEALQGEGGATLAAALRRQYPLALIDEFQDTDPIQYRIFRSVYESEGNLCFVGDPKQAIYAFRGADLATYLKAREEAARQYSLTTNHRSTPALIGALNLLFDRPTPFAEQDLDYPTVGASSKARAQLVLPEPLPPLGLVWLGDEPLTKGQASSLAAQDCARRIAALLAASHAGQAYFDEPECGRTPLRGGDIAVLVA
ncbi:hypothetical protein CK486_16825 [Pseudomonas sp. HAR-UPW-AIA-41]|nr:hypothetical protein CK486_16825 [Pseudomonas sp. HAR-UPW-AIA-41]